MIHESYSFAERSSSQAYRNPVFWDAVDEQQHMTHVKQHAILASDILSFVRSRAAVQKSIEEHKNNLAVYKRSKQVTPDMMYSCYDL